MVMKIYVWLHKNKTTQALDKTSFTVVVQKKREKADNNKQSNLRLRCLLIPNEKG
mgnify:CR=1 FL=1